MDCTGAAGKLKGLAFLAGRGDGIVVHGEAGGGFRRSKHGTEGAAIGVNGQPHRKNCAEYFEMRHENIAGCLSCSAGGIQFNITFHPDHLPHRRRPSTAPPSSMVLCMWALPLSHFVGAAIERRVFKRLNE